MNKLNSNRKLAVIEALADTQDGKTLEKNDDFSRFINCRIDRNTQNGLVDVEDLESDFRYMISQLENALKPIKRYNMLIDRATHGR